MVLVQKSFLGGLVNRFEFGESDMGFSQVVSGTGSSISYRVRYLNIPTEATTLTIPNRRAIRFALLALIIVGVFVWTELKQGPVLESMGFILPASFLVARRLSVITLIQFNTKMGRMQILQDKQTLAISQEINSRRRQAILKQYDEIDFRSAPDKALKALQWMKQEGYLTEDEFASRVAGLSSSSYRGEAGVVAPPRALWN